LLDELMLWRNAIAHNDFSEVAVGTPAVLTLAKVSRWRNGLNSLCDCFDMVMRDHLTTILTATPWT
jgi:hypothetical protein